MSRSIEQVNQTFIVWELHHRCGHRDTTFFFHFHPVRFSVLARATTFYCTRRLNRASEQKNLFCNGGFTRIRVRDDGEGSALRHFLNKRRIRHFNNLLTGLLPFVGSNTKNWVHNTPDKPHKLGLGHIWREIICLVDVQAITSVL
ncbi:hypothetical protein MADA3029_1080027 [Vibrio nigripulchritudo MADA3029]|nr:hypothetical protein VIBNIMADA3021_760031 [Vibrio nigripulchritudo MADA3021]CCN57219.1 hypothetical protein MADA3029_1080027 [Vibrio nigripulchritudo MADA3029]